MIAVSALTRPKLNQNIYGECNCLMYIYIFPSEFKVTFILYTSPVVRSSEVI